MFRAYAAKMVTLTRNRLSAFGVACAVLLAAGSALPAHADEDIVHFGENIQVSRDNSAKDLVCFFCSIDAEGEVHGDMVSFFGDIHIHGHANHSVVDFFGKVQADDGASIGEDVVDFFGGIQLGENVSVAKDAVVMFGSFDAPSSVNIGDDKFVCPAYIFWVPLMLLISAIWLVIHEFRGYRQRRILRGF